MNGSGNGTSQALNYNKVYLNKERSYSFKKCYDTGKTIWPFMIYYVLSFWDDGSIEIDIKTNKITGNLPKFKIVNICSSAAITRKLKGSHD